ncbi:hypothetical protein ACKI1I_15200 [Streptomyces turgidiscabies]|uniref:Putative lipoprotein n=1 Tax=Streptomyces turgidiscabies (strain Car8) TaxID=698760 RepID=L7F3D9_STRT8|nr:MULTISPECIES: hypothetical protein [Streptomyces]ELP65531.1 putative lipoprotein [Streptomyces turgidiscabies Car8]MDX3493226.1 hypothetical protein [Streptomyces turgidiscabies]GAQ70525.1 hypothetical protein T45_02260 [Streptomyces turgidiscabies]
MHKLTRHALLASVTVAALLTTGCSASSSPETADAAAAAAETPAAASAPDQLAVVQAPLGGTAPTAVATQDAAEAGKAARKSPLKVASYDRKSGRAVITAKSVTPPAENTATPPSSSSPSPSESTATPAAPVAPVAVGDVIASAPAPGAPDGLLAEVTEVVGDAADGGTEVVTKTAELNSVLGESKAEGDVPVDPSTIDVDPLVEGVKVSWAKTGDLTFGPEGARLPLGSLRIDVGAAIATAEGAPASASASVHGFVQLAPEVAFSYDGSGSGTGSAPGGAFLGLTGDWASKWSLKGRAAGTTTTDGKPLRVPFAKLHADPVIYAGPIPIVVNLDLVCYFQVAADGKVTVDVEQDLKGDFRVGGTFSWTKGWTPVSESAMTGTPLNVNVAATGDVKASLGAEASIGLYGTVGISADLAPYLRVEADASAGGSSDGTGSASGSWALYGGVDLSGALQIQLTIFGTPIFQQRIPLGELHREWPLAKGEAAATTAPATVKPAA